MLDFSRQPGADQAALSARAAAARTVDVLPPRGAPQSARGRPGSAHLGARLGHRQGGGLVRALSSAKRARPQTAALWQPLAGAPAELPPAAPRAPPPRPDNEQQQGFVVHSDVGGLGQEATLRHGRGLPGGGPAARPEPGPHDVDAWNRLLDDAVGLLRDEVKAEASTLAPLTEGLFSRMGELVERVLGQNLAALHTELGELRTACADVRGGLAAVQGDLGSLRGTSVGVHSGLSAVQSELVGLREAVDTCSQAGAELQGLREAASEEMLQIQRAADSSQVPHEVRELRSAVEALSLRRPEAALDVPEVAQAVARVLRPELEKLQRFQEESIVVVDVPNIASMIQDLSREIGGMGRLLEELRRPEPEAVVDLSPVLDSVRGVAREVSGVRPVLDRLQELELMVDLSPVMDAVQEISHEVGLLKLRSDKLRQEDAEAEVNLSQVLASVQGIACEVSGVRPVLNQLQQLEVQADLSTVLDSAREISRDIGGIKLGLERLSGAGMDTALSPVLESVQEIARDIGALRPGLDRLQQLGTAGDADLSLLLSPVREIAREVASLSPALERLERRDSQVDLSLVVDAVREVAREIGSVRPALDSLRHMETEVAVCPVYHFLQERDASEASPLGSTTVSAPMVAVLGALRDDPELSPSGGEDVDVLERSSSSSSFVLERSSSSELA